MFDKIINFNNVGFPFYKEIRKFGIKNPYKSKDVICDYSFLDSPIDCQNYPPQIFIRQNVNDSMTKLESGTFAKILKHPSELIIQ